MARERKKRHPARAVGLSLRIALYLALVASAIVTLAGQPMLLQRVEAGLLHPIWLIVPSICFGGFLTIYVIDRIWLVRFRHYPSGRALFQIILGLVFFTLLLPDSYREYRSAVTSTPQRDTLTLLLAHRDASVRAMACELAGCRPRSERYVQALGRTLLDKKPEVAQAAQQALLQITGRLFAVGEQGSKELERYIRQSNATPTEASPVPATKPATIGEDPSSTVGSPDAAGGEG